MIEPANPFRNVPPSYEDHLSRINVELEMAGIRRADYVEINLPEAEETELKQLVKEYKQAGWKPKLLENNTVAFDLEY